jgi:Ca2+-binding EF-hand superfamily protein
LVPVTDTGKVIAIFFIPLSVGLMGNWLGTVANWIMEARSRNYFRKTMAQQELTQRDLDIMDDNGDGFVTRAEYLEFMLIAMNKIDRNLIMELRRRFDILDADGTGDLSREDLIEAARRKMKSPSHKLGLSIYKKRLVDQARRQQQHRQRSRFPMFDVGKGFANVFKFRK